VVSGFFFFLLGFLFLLTYDSFRNSEQNAVPPGFLNKQEMRPDGFGFFSGLLFSFPAVSLSQAE
jgi:hypothetical protein